MQDLKVAIIQSKIYWENPGKNFLHFGTLIEQVEQKTDLIVLPEMFTTGFTMKAKILGEEGEGYSEDFLRIFAGNKQSYICGRLIKKEKGKYFNRMLVASPDGKIFRYDKKHLFRFGGEQKVYSSGNEHLIVKINGWRVSFFICYDLRFPVWCRNNNNYDALVFSANWPEVRVLHWKQLLLARAIENQSYCIGVNRTGLDGNNINCSGESAVIDPLGNYLINAKKKNGVFHSVLSSNLLKEFRKKFPAQVDADKFRLV